jgi:ubiquinone/menaquinone biosynthesis C-methylase UbiE
MTDARVTNYDRIADRFDTRYGLYGYDGVRDTVLSFLGPTPLATLEVGCGTGHWLAAMTGRASTLAGIEPSAPMLERARIAAPGARLVRARAEDLPCRSATFDRIVCVNALHHFSDRHRFFAEARRVLKPGGGLLTIGKDPHTERDEWWVYDYFSQTREIDLARFAAVRTLRGELALAGFAWTESLEADHIEVVQSAADALAGGVVDCSFTSQLSVLTAEEFSRGVEWLRTAAAERAAAGGELQLVADFRLYATIGWVS